MSTKLKQRRDGRVHSSDLVVPLGKRAARREAKLKAAEVLQNLIMDGEFEESAKPLIWRFIDKLRAQRGKRHNDPSIRTKRSYEATVARRKELWKTL